MTGGTRQLPGAGIIGVDGISHTDWKSILSPQLWAQARDRPTDHTSGGEGAVETSCTWKSLLPFTLTGFLSFIPLVVQLLQASPQVPSAS